MIQIKTQLLIIGSVLALSSCSSLISYQYTGDGQYVDYGPKATDVQSVVFLCDCQWVKAGTQELRVGRLPSDEYKLGFTCSGISMDDDLPKVRLILKHEKTGEEFLREEGDLNEWTWGSNTLGLKSEGKPFIFKRGQTKGKMEGNLYIGEKITVGPLDAWGTVFEARRGEPYQIIFEHESAEGVRGKCKLALLRRGWK